MTQCMYLKDFFTLYKACFFGPFIPLLLQPRLHSDRIWRWLGKKKQTNKKQVFKFSSNEASPHLFAPICGCLKKHNRLQQKKFKSALLLAAAACGHVAAANRVSQQFNTNIVNDTNQRHTMGPDKLIRWDWRRYNPVAFRLITTFGLKAASPWIHCQRGLIWEQCLGTRCGAA